MTADAAEGLLRFIDGASNNIQEALGTMGKTKRRVNHRTYLQRQLKMCSQSYDASGISSQAATSLTRNRKTTESTESLRQTISLDALFDVSLFGTNGNTSSGTPTEPSYHKITQTSPPLKKRKLPPSFFIEPYHDCIKNKKTQCPKLEFTDPFIDDVYPVTHMVEHDLKDILAGTWQDKVTDVTKSQREVIHL
ncbi:unnamed protein product [Owenia fusiformis]|uniref:Uncharacterized protein n=1 Tax=Owenia fusiformis TaxID=6347 RepID=A0A8J1TIT5_OWEFU|nr:unnamed protein product [Owenia fusiformis]